MMQPEIRRRDAKGSGWVVHDSNGSLICVRSKRINKKQNIKTLEAKAIFGRDEFQRKLFLEEMKMILDTCIQLQIPLEIEFDALEVIKVLLEEVEDLTEMKSIVGHTSWLTTNEYHHCCRSSNTQQPIVLRDKRVNWILFQTRRYPSHWKMNSFLQPLVIVFVSLLLLVKTSCLVVSH